jgi:hypothetical protein
MRQQESELRSPEWLPTEKGEMMQNEAVTRRIVLVAALLAIIVGAVSGPLLAGGSPTARVFSLADFSRVAGARGTIHRSADAMCLEVKTRNLPPGAYTLWGIGFDNPDGCEFGGGGLTPPLPGECGPGDDGNPNAEPFGQWVAAFIVGPNGKGHLNACIEPGAPSGQLLFGDGLDNPGAEIHGILRGHGEALYADPLNLGLQLTHVAGGCNITNACNDEQLVIYVP